MCGSSPIHCIHLCHYMIGQLLPSLLPKSSYLKGGPRICCPLIYRILLLYDDMFSLFGKLKYTYV